MPSNTDSKRCQATNANGQPCKSWTIRGTNRCAAHSGKTGAPKGNKNRETHGFYTKPKHPFEGIDDVITDALDKQARLSAILATTILNEDIELLAKLLAIHGQNASRLGRLLRDKRALSGESADGLLSALGVALDEISTELGITL